MSQEKEFNVLGCRVKFNPLESDSHKAKAVIDVVVQEIEDLKSKRPLLRDTDIAVLVALKLATDKFDLEDEYKSAILKLEESLQTALQITRIESN